MTFHVSPDALDLALTHIIARGDTDILPPALEYRAIFNEWPQMKDYLSRADLDTWPVRSHRTFLSPKRGLGFRLATQLDPFDCLLLTALVYECGNELEAARLPTTAGVVHSHRFLPTPDGNLYDPTFGWESFRNRSLELASQANYVVSTDISDFYSRLYHHPLENALRQACRVSPDHARVLFKMLKNFNQGVSHGVPVGPAAVRLIADVTIDDIDRALLSEGYTFCRYSDDYRIFVQDHAQARKALAFLARSLFPYHGLTLQESKTEILPAGQFIERFSRTEAQAIQESLTARLEDLISELRRKEEETLLAAFSGADEGWPDVPEFTFLGAAYGDVSYEDLTEEQRALVDSVNLWDVLGQQISRDGSLDQPLTRLVLRRIAALKLPGNVDLLFGNLERLYPLFVPALLAITSQGYHDDASKVAIAGRLLDLFDDPVVGHLEYHRAWILSAFASDPSWNHSDRLAQMYGDYADVITRAALINALGEAGMQHWFRVRKNEVMALGPWERRAFLSGSRCLPLDEGRYWLQSIMPQLDPLEQAVARWAKSQLT